MSVDPLALIRKAAAATLNAQAKVVQKEAVVLAPRDLGGLEESIKINKATSRGLVAQVYTDLEYAVYMHEALDLRHDDGGPKYLERASLEQKATIVAAAAAAARKVMD